jgi:hypothetical protein
MQGINVFTNATARDAAITAPAEGQFAFTKDNNSLWYYDGAAWVASGATGDIEGVTAGVGISGGGTSGTVTVTNSMATAIDAKGDLVPGTGADTFARLAVGANGTVLTADSAEATGLKWATPASGGGMTLLATTNCSGSSSITFSSISQSYKHLLITWDYIYNTSASSNMYFQFNSGVSLSWSSVDLNGTSLNGASGGGYSATQSLATPNNSTPGNTGAMWVYDYANTSRYKSFALQSHGYSTATSSLRGYHNYGLIENPSSGITSINLTNGATWGGGQVRLWGLS